jgi:SlyX protein
MTPQELEHRLADLETRVAFQEQALLELSDALAAARDEETRTALLLHRALEELKAIRTTLSSAPVTGDASLEPPPPHY